MPAPLPKPAVPKLPNSGAGTPSTPPPASQPTQVVGGKPVVPQTPTANPSPATPPVSKPVTPSTPAAPNSPTTAQPVAAKPPMPAPQSKPASPAPTAAPVVKTAAPVATAPQVSPAQPRPTAVATPPATPQPAAMPPKAPAVPPAQLRQMPPAPAPVGTPVGKSPMVPAPIIGAPTPTVPGKAPAPVRVQQPPQTLTALSSMASNRLPSGAGKGSIAEAPKANPGMQQPLTSTPQAPKTTEFVQPKKSILRFLPFIAGGVLLLLLIGFVAFRFLGSSTPSSVSTSKTGSTNGSSGGTSGTGSTANNTTGGTTAGKQITLEYWGLWEPSEAMDDVIKDYQSKNPGVNIKYTKQSYKDYRTRLQTAVNSGNGPDIFRFHASWVPMLKQELSPLPTAIMSTSDFQNTFYPIAAQQLSQNGQFVGIPLMYDGLVLFYNTDIFKTAVLEPPKTWADLRADASKLILKPNGVIKRGGIALGNATNVDHFSDILAVLMLENNADMTKPNSPEVHDALLFYTNFIKTDGVWSDTLPSSTIAFARGDVAMMFAPSWRAFDIKATNPDLHFATVPLPQLSEKRVGWGTYWAEGVSNKSKNKDEAWKFLKYLSSKEVQQKLVSSQAQTRAFGEIYSRKDLADSLAQDPVLAAIVQDAPYAQNWYMNSATHDDGLNDQIIQYYQDAVTAILQGKSIDEVQKTLDQGVTQVLRQYGVSTTTSTTQTTR